MLERGEDCHDGRGVTHNTGKKRRESTEIRLKAKVSALLKMSTRKQIVQA